MRGVPEPDTGIDSDPSSAPDNGRSHVRGRRLRARVLTATLSLIEDRGLEQVRISDVAALAGVHETSIYRRWKTRPRLLVDALTSRITESVPLPDTGSVREDLELFFEALARFAGESSGAALIRVAVISDADDEATSVVREFWEHRLTAVEEIVRRGIRRGELADNTDPRLVMVALGGIVHLYVGQLATAIPPDLGRQAVALLIDGAARR